MDPEQLFWEVPYWTLKHDKEHVHIRSPRGPWHQFSDHPNHQKLGSFLKYYAKYTNPYGWTLLEMIHESWP